MNTGLRQKHSFFRPSMSKRFWGIFSTDSDTDNEMINLLSIKQSVASCNILFTSVLHIAAHNELLEFKLCH